MNDQLWGSAADWVAAAAGIVTAGTAITLAVALERRERTQALTELHVALTTGDIGRARNVLGTLMYSRKYRHSVSELDGISAYFQLMWAVHHAYNVFNHYKLEWDFRHGTPTAAPQGRRTPRQAQIISNALTWNLQEIEHNLERFHDAYADKWEIEDADAWSELQRIVKGGATRPPKRTTVGEWVQNLSVDRVWARGRHQNDRR
ncbi:hypothetical protein ACIPC2_14610 [Curtobacterium pusillum]|uniref:hypothetical protein n=1 Tax=Curtobacterium pusillum TaxID=69373 RepID=UPI00380F3B0D